MNKTYLFVGIGVAAFLALSLRGMSSVNSNDDEISSYDTQPYNSPGIRLPTERQWPVNNIPGMNNPTQETGGQGGCGCGNFALLYPGIQSLVDYYYDTMGDMLESYMASVYDAYAGGWEGQYLNNYSGAMLSKRSIALLT